MNVSTRNLLRNIVEKFGTDFIKNSGLCDAYLSDLMPTYPKERALLVDAVSEGIPAQLLVDNSARHQKVLAERMANTYLIPEVKARNVVDAWSFALKKEYERIHQNNDRHATRHYLGGVLTGLIVLGVSSAIAVYQVPDGGGLLLRDSLLQSSTQNALVSVSSPKVRSEVDEEPRIHNMLLLDSDHGGDAVALPSLVENDAASPVTLVSESDVLPDHDEFISEDRHLSGFLSGASKDFLHESDSTIKIPDFNQPLPLMSVGSFAKAQRQTGDEVNTRYAVPQLIKEEKRLSEKILAREKEMLTRVNEERESRKQAVVNKKLAEQRQPAEVTSMKKAEQALVRQQAAVNQANRSKWQATNNSQKHVAKVQSIAHQLMGSSITFGQLSVFLQKKQADLGVLKNLLKLTQEDFYLQQQREVNSKIDSLRKRQDVLSARYVQYLQQLCNLPAISVQRGVYSLGPAYAGERGIKAVAFRMLRQHTARCNQVKRIRNHTLARELSFAYRRVSANP